MARPVYSKQFFQWLNGSGLVASFAVPAGFVAVVKDLSGIVLAPSSGVAIVQASIGSSAYWYFAELPAGSPPLLLAYRGSMVVPAGQVIQMEVAGAGTNTGVCSGYLLSL
jgi:hypothetical protein